MTSEFSDLHTPRLVLRRLSRDDVIGLTAYRSLPEVARFQSWDSFGDGDAAQLIAEQLEQSPDTPGSWFQLAIVRADSGELIGDCGLHCRREDPRQMEIGITLAPKHQGRGFATEALRAVLEYIFVSLRKHRVTAITDMDHAAAAALLRRLGFRQEACFVENIWFKGKWGSEIAFALLRREWEASRLASPVQSGPG